MPKALRLPVSQNRTARPRSPRPKAATRRPRANHCTAPTPPFHVLRCKLNRAAANFAACPPAADFIRSALRFRHRRLRPCRLFGVPLLKTARCTMAGWRRSTKPPIVLPRLSQCLRTSASSNAAFSHFFWGRAPLRAPPPVLHGRVGHKPGASDFLPPAATGASQWGAAAAPASGAGNSRSPPVGRR